jgi:hypothetical protein
MEPACSYGGSATWPLCELTQASKAGLRGCRGAAEHLDGVPSNQVSALEGQSGLLQILWKARAPMTLCRWAEGSREAVLWLSVPEEKPETDSVQVAESIGCTVIVAQRVLCRLFQKRALQL